MNRRAVWARSGVISRQCPKSVITPQSLYFLEQFRFWKQLGGGNPDSMNAKTAEAIVMLDEAYRVESQRGEI